MPTLTARVVSLEGRASKVDDKIDSLRQKVRDLQDWTADEDKLRAIEVKRVDLLTKIRELDSKRISLLEQAKIIHDGRSRRLNAALRRQPTAHRSQK